MRTKKKKQGSLELPHRRCLAVNILDPDDDFLMRKKTAMEIVIDVASCE